MPDKAWKNRERLVSKFFGGVRNALSGINSKVTHADVIHDDLLDNKNSIILAMSSGSPILLRG